MRHGRHSGRPLRVAIVGSGPARRGPAQAAFTTSELKELGDLAGADVVVDPAELELVSASEAMLAEDVTARGSDSGVAGR